MTRSAAFDIAYRMATKQGWYLFPVGADKLPLVQWKSGSTNIAEKLQAYADRYPDCWWGLDCEKSGLVVLDIDVKHDKHGDETILALQQEHGDLPKTFQVLTPSGGYHLYFEGVARSTVQALGRGVDTRGVGGYVVVAGGPPDDESSYRVAVNRVPAQLPSWIADLLARTTADADAKTPVVDLDTEGAFAEARYFLEHDATPAIEGNGGDRTTYETACAVKDLGLGQDATCQLMTDYYNPRCVPPWSSEELERKVANAFKYGQSAAGCESAYAAFDCPLPKPLPATKSKPQPSFSVQRADRIRPSEIPKRQWIIHRRLIRGYVTVTISPGGVGKSMYTMLEAVSAYTGKDLTGNDVTEKTGVWIYNTEDPMDELQRRMIALCEHHHIPLADLDGIHISSGRTSPLVLVYRQHNEILINTKAIDQIISYIRAHNIGVFCVDPFVRTHRVNENDNMEIDLVVQAFNKIASETNCAISIVHHARKRGSNGADGDMDSGRGASSLVSAARIAHTLGGMDDKTAKTFDIPEMEARWYVRVDDAKANMAPPAEYATWFRRYNIQLSNGDQVGTIARATIQPMVQRDRESALELLKSEIWRMYDKKRLLTGTRYKMRDIAESVLLSDIGAFVFGSAKQLPNAQKVKRMFRHITPMVRGDVVMQMIETQHGRGVYLLFASLEDDESYDHDVDTAGVEDLGFGNPHIDPEMPRDTSGPEDVV